MAEQANRRCHECALFSRTIMGPMCRLPVGISTARTVNPGDRRLCFVGRQS